jgi:hypothetical protein
MPLTGWPTLLIKSCMFKKIIFLLIVCSCSTAVKKAGPTPVTPTPQPKEFSRGELILGTQLLTKIFDQEMAPLECVPDTDEASLLLRTIRPRMEIVQDDTEAMLDDSKEIADLIKTCDQNCTCGYVDDLLREHLVNLTKAQKDMLSKKKQDKELNRCLNYVQSTFCQSELYKTLNSEKADFSFEED